MSEVKNKKVQSDFQHTEIGIFPNDWSIHQLVDVAENNGLVRGPFGGALKKNSFVKKGFKVYEQRNAIYSSVDIGRYYISASKFQELSRFSVNSGEFIVSCSGTIGRIYQIPKNAPKGIINQALLKIKLNSLIEPRYFYQVFNSDSFQDRITDSTQGGAMKNLIGMSEFKKSIIPLPSLQEQTAIATALSDVDNLIQSLEKLIAKKEAIKTGTMQQLLTGKTRLPDFATHDGGSPKGFKQTELGRIPEDWEVNYIGKIANFRNGVAHENFIDTNGHYIAVNSKFISTEGKVYKRTKILRNPAYKDEILMVMSDLPNGKALAKCFLVTVNNAFSVNQRICSLNIVSDIPKFVFYQLNRNPFYLAFDDGVKQTNLRRQDVLDCPVALPSIKEQTAIATILSDMDTEIQVLQERLEKTRDIKQGMMQQLLTGKVRLAH